MEAVTPARELYEILARSSLADDRALVLKHGDSFAVFDRHGDIPSLGPGYHGIYHAGTRFLSHSILRLEGIFPILLSSTVGENNALLTVDFTNPNLFVEDKLVTPQGALHLSRSKFLSHGVCYERLHLTNFRDDPIDLTLTLEMRADFADIFEVRGTKRKQRGRLLDAELDQAGMVLAYEGLDGVRRESRITCSSPPDALSDSEISFRVSLGPQQGQDLEISIGCETSGARSRVVAFKEASAGLLKELEEATAQDCAIYTSNEQFNDWLNRSIADLRMMVTRTVEGPYPYAGVPWFNTPFGRDGILTALESLWVNPNLAQGVLRYLASTQAQDVNVDQDAQPGKILHETRSGEMAALGEVPFGRYYGSVDATPLFLMLAGRYYDWSGDLTLIEQIWPRLEQALQWIDEWGDLDHDGFVEYARQSETGLVQQGWKDSHDSVFHEDGALAPGPIALCEVQGYVYAAKRDMTRLAYLLGHLELAGKLANEAQALQSRFEEAFWSDELGTYVLALDGQKRPCRVRASNAGHCLFTEVAGAEHAARTAETLLSRDSFSGWGVRTLASGQARYNPMSYHNGSVWPHDNALIADGLARYGFKEMALKILTGLFDASLFVDLHRLPELFCGFRRRSGDGPTLYPVACSPQAWAAASVFLLLQACLGLSVNGHEKQLRFNNPVLPPFLSEVLIRNLRVGTSTVDVSLHRYPNDVGVNLLRRSGPVDVVISK